MDITLDELQKLIAEHKVPGRGVDPGHIYCLLTAACRVCGPIAIRKDTNSNAVDHPGATHGIQTNATRRHLTAAVAAAAADDDKRRNVDLQVASRQASGTDTKSCSSSRPGSSSSSAPSSWGRRATFHNHYKDIDATYPK
ncbi:hypothetical protein VYU27_000571 [Nannochloropsis oceanica]